MLEQSRLALRRLQARPETRPGFFLHILAIQLKMCQHTARSGRNAELEQEVDMLHMLKKHLPMTASCCSAFACKQSQGGSSFLHRRMQLTERKNSRMATYSDIQTFQMCLSWSPQADEMALCFREQAEVACGTPEAEANALHSTCRWCLESRSLNHPIKASAATSSD